MAIALYIAQAYLTHPVCTVHLFPRSGALSCACSDDMQTVRLRGWVGMQVGRWIALGTADGRTAGGWWPRLHGVTMH